MTVGRSDMSKFTEGSWQGSFTVNSERAVQVFNNEVLLNKKSGLREIPSRPGFDCKFADFQRLLVASDALLRIESRRHWLASKQIRKSGEGKRGNEFAEWHVAQLAE